MSEQVFVARERELARLDEFLDLSLAGQGQVAFVVGEPGAGKTALLQEFTRRAQVRHLNLVAAVGNCNAQTGVGQPYLPFREALGLLTGDLEAKLAEGMISLENASRVRKLLARSGLIILEVAPELIDVLVPGGKLITTMASTVGQAVAKQAGLEGKLEEIASRKPAALEMTRNPVEQEQIFEQCARFLQTLAKEQPLVIVLDDLHWSDASSLSLLFHLGRRLQNSRILILGSYRPDEVAYGRDSQRHPVEKVVSEFKRYYGDIIIDLAISDEQAVRTFVDAYVDSQPNLLTFSFRQALCEHTGGNCLFLVELMRDMQERGDIIKNEYGKWVETQHLDWHVIPKRVEGVIEERVERLEQSLRKLLNLASVEGEQFIAELLARLLGANERELVQQLSTDLGRQHRLIHAENVSRLGGHRLSFYRFNHRPVRQYLYEQLDAVELIYLHEDIGLLLEEFFADQREEVALQLAWHFSEAGVNAKAVEYLIMAGKQAANRYAHDEALQHLDRALEYVSPGDADVRFEILTTRETMYKWQGKRQEQWQDLESLTELIETLPSVTPHAANAEILLRKADFARITGDYETGLHYVQQAVEQAEKAGDERKEAAAYALWGRILMRLGQYAEAQEWLEMALELSQPGWDAWFVADTIYALGANYYASNRLNIASEQFKKALDGYEQMANSRGVADCQQMLGGIALVSGQYDVALTYLQDALSMAQTLGWRRGEALALGTLGTAFEILGAYEHALDVQEQALDICRTLRDVEGEAVNLDMLGLLHHRLDNQVRAEDYLRQALSLQRSIADRRSEGYTLTHLGWVLLTQDQFEAARQVFSGAYAIRLEVDMGGGTSIDALAGLAAIAMLVGEIAVACAYVDEILAWIDAHDVESVEYPVQAYWICYQTLEIASRSDQSLVDRAATVLRKGHELLLQRAQKIQDATLREQFLTSVPFNRNLMESWPEIGEARTSN